MKRYILIIVLVLLNPVNWVLCSKFCSKRQDDKVRLTDVFTKADFYYLPEYKLYFCFGECYDGNYGGNLLDIYFCKEDATLNSSKIKFASKEYRSSLEILFRGSAYCRFKTFNNKWDNNVLNLVCRDSDIYVLEKYVENNMFTPALYPLQKIDYLKTNVELIKYTDTRFFTEVDGNYVPNDSIVLIKLVRDSKDRNDIKVLYQDHYHKVQELKPIG